jgi:hypothetical protein
MLNLHTLSWVAYFKISPILIAMNQLWKKQIATGLLIATSLIAPSSYAATKLSTGDDVAIAAAVIAGTSATNTATLLAAGRRTVPPKGSSSTASTAVPDEPPSTAEPSDPQRGVAAGARDAEASGVTDMRGYTRPINVSDDYAQGHHTGYKGTADFNATAQAREAMTALNAQHAAASAETSRGPSETSNQLDADGHAITGDANLMETNIDAAASNVADTNARTATTNAADENPDGTGDDPVDIDLTPE